MKKKGNGFLDDRNNNELLSAAVFADERVSWRIKASKATSEGRKETAAVSNALHVFDERVGDRSRDATRHHPKMRVPKPLDSSLSWGKKKRVPLAENTSLNNFANDGTFMDTLRHQQNSAGTISPNHLAAKAMQLRMKGKLEEADKLLKESQEIKKMQDLGSESTRTSINVSIMQHLKKDEDTDLLLAKKIKYDQHYGVCVSGLEDDDYGYDDGPRRKIRKKEGDAAYKMNYSVKRIVTQQERCKLCFENPSRPKHLLIAVANFTYLSLPQKQPVVPGHCCILTLQHESSTRTVDDVVWDEIRNFKKCLIMMFAKQGKDVIFLETVKGLAQQRRHCMVECIPVPREVAKQAPAYFKKAIDEAEDEWSQHNAKKLIETTGQNGLRASIPKNFPYFHVEFGLKNGYVHVIDNEKEFISSFGSGVLKGMMRLPVEDSLRHQLNKSTESQSFTKDWEAFDWTKQLI